VLQDWLPLHQDAIEWVIDQAIWITSFLRAKGVAHLDANPSNILTDGKQLFFADFGLFLDHNFELTDQERAFLDGHRYFDIADFIASLDCFPDQAVEQDDVYQHALRPYRALIDEMSAWFSRLTAGPKTSSGYSDSRIASLLAEARPHHLT
jgi:serine/threonine protein kinase